jgi:uncharacterized protein YbjT (DUF2867 family)
LTEYIKAGGPNSVNGLVVTVFGATGFLGKHIVSQLGYIGSQVIVPYRGDMAKVRQLKLNGDLGQIVPIPYDMNDVESIKNCMKNSHIVINLIGTSYEYNKSYEEVNVYTGYRIAQYAKAMGVKHFIQVSMLGANKDSSSSLYQSKFKGEEAIKEFYPHATIIRPAPMFGPNDRFLVRYAYQIKMRLFLPLSNPGRLLQPIYVGDVARATLNAIVDKDAEGKTYELCGKDVIREEDLIKHLIYIQDYSRRGTFIWRMNEKVATIYGKMMQGPQLKRKFQINPYVDGLVDLVFGLVNLFGRPRLYNADIPQQSKTDLIAKEKPGLRELGIQEPVSIDTMYAKIIRKFMRRHYNRFRGLDFMRRDAKMNPIH